LVKFVEFISTECLSLILLISFLTLIFSGLRALVEGDAKKVVAFSTLSQISLIFIIVVCVRKALSIFHIITHAIFKSLLFMCVGICIHNIFSLQDWRFYSTTAFN
jgi:NADH:ubiquinone oxidoreductase subunit 5 (subunit L)/multisubunit Na+/H+ antiporter MnhA subunit